MSLCAFAQLVATFIFFSACDKSRFKWDNSRNLTQKMRTSDTVLLVGGSNEVGLPSHYSWSYNFINGTWTLGPPLWESRYGHFCGKFKAYQNNRTFAVVAGKVINHYT